MACNCQDNHQNNSCDNSISFKLDGSYLVPFCGDVSLMPLDLSPIVQESETDTRLQLDQSLRRLVYTGEHAQRGISSPDSISIVDMANLIALNELQNVDFSISSNGDVLSYDDSTDTWISYTVPNGTIVTPVGVGADGNLVKDGSGGTPQAPDTVPLGGILIWPAPIADIPVSYRECNGQALSRTVYSDLYDLIGTTYGAGDGSTTFNLPSIGSRQVSGYNPNDTQYNVIGQTGGSKTRALSSSNNGPHTHSVNPPSTSTSSDTHNHKISVDVARTTGSPGNRTDSGGNGQEWRADDPSTTNDTHNHTVNIPTFTSGSSGSGTAFSILDQYITMPFMMRVV